MNVEVVPKQGKLSKGVLTIKVADGMLHKVFSFTTALMHDWIMYGMKKQNGDIEIISTHEHFEPIMFDRALRFDNTILVAAKIKTLQVVLPLVRNTHYTFFAFLCDSHRTRRFCTRAGPAISEYHPIDEYKLQIA